MPTTDPQPSMTSRSVEWNRAGLGDLRLRPANSNDVARARIVHRFGQVPRCSFARDDGISHYLGSQSQIGNYPAAPGTVAVSGDEAPDIGSEAPGATASPRGRLTRGGFALSVFLHTIAAVAIGYATLTPPDEDSLTEGALSVSIIVEGSSDIAQTAAGDIEETYRPADKPLPEAALKPIEAKTPDVLEDPLMPELGMTTPEILATTQPAEAKAEIAAKSVFVEVAVEPLPRRSDTALPVENPAEARRLEPVVAAAQPLAHPLSKSREARKVIEKAPEPGKDEPKKEVEKKRKPREKRQTTKGSQGNATDNADRGEVDAANPGQTASENSRGGADNREIGNAARTNYKGLVQKKLQRAKGRVRSPGKGKVTIAFTIGANGDVTELRVTRSSGKDAIDAAALKIVRNASPFPDIPADSGRKTWKMSVPIEFKG